MNRLKIGLVAVVLLVASFSLWIWGQDDSQTRQWQSACFRVGLVMGVIWLAYPELKRVENRILLGGLFIIAIVAAWRPMFLPYVIGALAAIWFILPKQQRQAGRRG